MAIASPNTTARILADLTQRAAQSAPQSVKDNDELTWIEYDPDSLSPALRQMNNDRKQANALAREIERKFKDQLNEELHREKLIGADQTMLCSFVFGKLRCAVIATADVKQKPKAKAAAVFGFKRG